MAGENPTPSEPLDPWNKGRLIGQKRPLKPKDVWTIRVRLQLQGRKRDLAMFNLAIDSKLRGCDLIRVRIDGVWAGGRVRDRAARRTTSPERLARDGPRREQAADATDTNNAVLGRPWELWKCQATEPTAKERARCRARPLAGSY
jgi:hypothetical protein